MTQDQPVVSKFSALSTIAGAALGFSLLFLFALSGFVNMIYDGGAPAHQQMAAHHDAEDTASQHASGDDHGTSGGPQSSSGETAGEPADAKIDLPALLAKADSEKGAKVAKKCAACHTFDKGGKNKVGPNLYGILGKTIASASDFNYSPAMSEYAAKSGKWSFENLAAYLRKPKDVVPKTKMAFVGVKKDRDLANLILYLRDLADNKLPLPTN